MLCSPTRCYLRCSLPSLIPVFVSQRGKHSLTSFRSIMLGGKMLTSSCFYHFLRSKVTWSSAFLRSRLLVPTGTGEKLSKPTAVLQAGAALWAASLAVPCCWHRSDSSQHVKSQPMLQVNWAAWAKHSSQQALFLTFLPDPSPEWSTCPLYA